MRPGAISAFEVVLGCSAISLSVWSAAEDTFLLIIALAGSMIANSLALKALKNFC